MEKSQVNTRPPSRDWTALCICFSLSQSGSSSFSAFGWSSCGFIVIINFHTLSRRNVMRNPLHNSFFNWHDYWAISTNSCFGKTRRHYFLQQFSLIECNVTMWFLMAWCYHSSLLLNGEYKWWMQNFYKQNDLEDNFLLKIEIDSS